MGATQAPSPALSLRAPISNEAERAVFQRRLSLTSGLACLLAFGFYVVTVSVAVARGATRLLDFTIYGPTIGHLATTAACGVLWLFVRRGSRSVRVLATTDFVAFIGVCWGWIAMIAAEPEPGQRPEMVSLLACSYTLATRAAFIPSTPGRTALVGIAAFAPLVPLSRSIHARGVPVVEVPLPMAMYVALWSALGVAVTVAISFVVHGMRVEIRKATKAGPYVLEAKIGEGGMGVVYRASHALLRRPAAIKLLSHATEQAIVRFEREVQTTAKLTHPHTVHVFDYGRTPEGTFYYAMELLEGVTLEQLVVDHGPQPPGRVVHLLLQVCGALAEAHDAGLVHRDVKPANIILTERGLLPDFVKVVDFGLVKDLEAPSTTGQSNVNMLIGTPHYLAPEAIADPQRVDRRADLYALGVTAYYLLTGQHPFEGESIIEICSKHLHETPSPPSEQREGIPKSIDRLVLACLAKKPEDRPSSAAALARALEDARLETGAWTTDDARAWWERARQAPASPRQTPSDASMLGKTVAATPSDQSER